MLSVHVVAGRPLGFDQVVTLSGNRINRAQAVAASATLCRDGQLDRLRPGVYQWSAGQRAALQVPQTRSPEPAPPTRQGPRMSAAQLFDQLFPSGVKMTGALLADIEQWTHLTAKLTTHGSAPQDNPDA